LVGKAGQTCARVAGKAWPVRNPTACPCMNAGQGGPAAIAPRSGVVTRRHFRIAITHVAVREYDFENPKVRGTGEVDTKHFDWPHWRRASESACGRELQYQ